MAKNYVQEGRYLEVTAPAAVSSGDLVKVGSIFGVAQGDAASGATVVIDTQGVHTLGVASAVVVGSVTHCIGMWRTPTSTRRPPATGISASP